MAYNSTKQVIVPGRNGIRVAIPIVAGVGNAIMAVPMIRQLKRATPDAHISVFALTKSMVEPLRRLKEVEDHHISGIGLGGFVSLVRAIRQKKADIVLIPFPSNRWQYNLLLYFSKGKQRVIHGFDQGKKAALSFLPATRVSAERQLHDVVQNLRLLEQIGIKIDPNEKPIFPLELEDIRAGERLRNEANLKEREPYIIMHAGSANTVLAQAKRWPAERYAGLLQAIARTLKIPVVFVEGPDEVGVSKPIMDWVEPGKADVRIVSLGGPIGDAAGLFSNALAYVGSDSGLAHLAAAVGIPAVTLFAPSDPDRVCPAGNRSLVVQAQKMCSPCFMYPYKATSPRMLCSPPYCIETIMVESVMHKLQLALNPQQRGSIL